VVLASAGRNSVPVIARLAGVRREDSPDNPPSNAPAPPAVMPPRTSLGVRAPRRCPASRCGCSPAAPGVPPAEMAQSAPRGASTALTRPMTSHRGDPARGPAGVVPAAPAGACGPPRTIELYSQSVRYFSRWLTERDDVSVLDELAEPAQPAIVGTRLRGNAPVLPVAGHGKRIRRLPPPTASGSPRRHGPLTPDGDVHPHRDPRPTVAGG
jgi:hypothetical protein